MFAKDRLLPGSLDDWLRADYDTKAILNHCDDLVLGRVSDGSLRFLLRPQALFFELLPYKSELGLQVIADVRDGKTQTMSFGYEGRPRSTTDRSDLRGYPFVFRTFDKIRLEEISLLSEGHVPALYTTFVRYRTWSSLKPGKHEF
jgi:HK97 family phage prohead protease